MQISTKRVNVLFIVPSLQFGGAEKKIVDFILRMDKTKFCPIVCKFVDNGDYEVMLKQSFIKIYTVRRRFKYDLSVVLKLIAIMKTEHIQIVQTTLVIANLFGRIAAILAHVPIIIATEHSMGSGRQGIYTIINRYLSYLTDKIIVVAKAQKLFLNKVEHIPNDKMQVIYNGVDINKFHPKPKDNEMKNRFAIRDTCKVVGILATLRPTKGHELFLKAARKILRLVSDVKFLIVGDGPERENIKKIAFELNISANVIFAGNIIDVPQVLSLFDISVLSSSSEVETFPNALLESMAMGIPVVSTNVGAVDEIIIDGEVGFLIQPGNSEMLAEKVVVLLKDEQLRLKMGNAARKRVVEFFNIDTMIKERETLYETLLVRKNLICHEQLKIQY